MALTENEIKDIRNALDESARPLFFFDDDPDGVCAFLQLYRFKGDGRGVIVKAGSELTEDFVRKVDEYQPDLIIILDMPLVSQDFIDRVSQKIIWIDHHPPVKRKKINYYNPRIHDDKDSRPTSYWAWQVAKKDLWIGMLGCVSDWFVPEFKDEFTEQFPSLFDKSITEPDEALFNTKIGLLAKIINFNLKGKTSDVMKSIKVLTRIESPLEIINQTTPQGRFIYKKFQRLNDEYESLLNDAKTTDEKLLLFTYPYSNNAYTSELSNELLHKFPDKFIVVGRVTDIEVKGSARGKNVKVLPILKKALEGVDGYGGGHDYACGFCINKDDFDKFLDVIRNELA